MANDLMTSANASEPIIKVEPNGKYPKVFFSLVDRVAPRIIKNALEEAALNPKEWTTIPAPVPQAGEEPLFPAIYSNINVPAMIVHNETELAQLGEAWVRLDIEGVFIPVPPEEPPVEDTESGTA